MRSLVTFWLAVFGKAEDFLATRQGGEAAFWQQARGSALRAARQWPQGLGWYFLAKRFLLRQVLPPVLIFGVTVTLLMAGFGGWMATKEQRDFKAQIESRKQAFERFSERIEKAKQGAANGQK